MHNVVFNILNSNSFNYRQIPLVYIDSEKISLLIVVLIQITELDYLRFGDRGGNKI
jgi:hypothetical protein